MTASLVVAGFPVDMLPVHPKMGALVEVSSEMASSVLAKKPDFRYFGSDRVRLVLLEIYLRLVVRPA